MKKPKKRTPERLDYETGYALGWNAAMHRAIEIVKGYWLPSQAHYNREIQKGLEERGKMKHGIR